MSTLNLDRAGRLDIILVAGHSWDITFEGSEPIFADAVLKMIVLRSGGLAQEFTEADAITVESPTKLVISRLAIQNELASGSYNYHIRVDYTDGKSLPFATGQLTVKKQGL
jgi:hypothetical protein